MTTYFTSDLHLGHLNIIRYTGRPFPDVPAMNDRLVGLWNETVGDGDTVWVLGDVALGALDESLACVGRLAGRKLLVPGNHDRCWAGDRALRTGDPETRERRRTAARQRYLDAGFAEIHDSPATVVVDGRDMTLSHFPYSGDSHGEDRYVEYRPADRGGWVVHGHVHTTWRQRGRQINVGVDAWGGRPVAAGTVATLVADGPQELAPVAWT
ncbi:metallophosphoesterase [Promicromonospora thailandica]|uniref:Calcineurin-like phosphoesterase superfamily protein n=1 Tax=Promicromonospora thailandica TaxID=765201 RepID=A0A9X2G289_9MICO|nr:metallophosphoesterase [Promicromonospora thailandica]MCP2265735.1 Calcineurin-like phosphoesterase superfamily protein [Promicromonospora thailandica]BFF21748.1 metallophosphoesterase [Promicromonospora thailandica]